MVGGTISAETPSSGFGIGLKPAAITLAGKPEFWAPVAYSYFTQRDTKHTCRTQLQVINGISQPTVLMEDAQTDLRHSPLQQDHLDLGARMVPFAGWNMPVQYEGIIPEVKAVRESLGVFDISHMGQLWVRSSDDDGRPATRWLNRMLTNNVEKLQDGEGQYSLLLNDDGGVIDDLIVYRTGTDEFFLVVNASCVDVDFAWFREHIVESVELSNASDQFAAIAVQGSKTVEAFSEMIQSAGDCSDCELPKRFAFKQFKTAQGSIIVCRTGYTGEDGFELFCNTESASNWWQLAVSSGAKPAGLGARDILRLEKCYPLNGSDLSSKVTPLEAGLGFAVDLKKDSFIGRDKLAEQKTKGPDQKLAALKMIEKSPPPRHGYSVFHDDSLIGELTSGGVSPTLGCGIGMAYIPAANAVVGTELSIEIRGRRFAAEVVRKPFL